MRFPSTPHRRSLVSVSLTMAMLAVSFTGREATAQSETQVLGPGLSAASNFSQGVQPETLRNALALGVRDFRDGLNWDRAEPEPGRYDFDDPRTGYLRQITAQGATVSVVLNFGNSLYQDGATPTEPDSLAALGRLTDALLGQFPEITSLEVGNEFNGVNFVRGPIRELSPLDRARAYVPMLATVTRAARVAQPGVRISGIGTHSIPAAYIWTVLDAGGADLMDTMAIHPYTTPAEQFVRQIDVLRRHPLAASLPIEVTEFGHPDPARAAGHFLRNYCQFALGGVIRAAWYPLNDRGDDMVPLFSKDGRITPAGQAFRLIARWMENRPVTAAQSDSFSYGCQFGEGVLVLWGMPRAVIVAPGIEVLNADGAAHAGRIELSETDPLVFVTQNGRITDFVTVSGSTVVADSFHQFAYPIGDEMRAPGDGFERFLRRGGREFPLLTLPGQQERGVPWYPYRGNPDLGAVRLTSEHLLPGGRGDRSVEIVHRYVADRSGTFEMTARFAPARRSQDGVNLRITVNGSEVFAAGGKEVMTANLQDLQLDVGDRIEIAVGPGPSPDGDVTDYRITIRRSDP